MLVVSDNTEEIVGDFMKLFVAQWAFWRCRQWDHSTGRLNAAVMKQTLYHLKIIKFILSLASPRMNNYKDITRSREPTWSLIKDRSSAEFQVFISGSSCGQLRATHVWLRKHQWQRQKRKIMVNITLIRVQILHFMVLMLTMLGHKLVWYYDTALPSEKTKHLQTLSL